MRRPGATVLLRLVKVQVWSGARFAIGGRGSGTSNPKMSFSISVASYSWTTRATDSRRSEFAFGLGLSANIAICTER